MPIGYRCREYGCSGLADKSGGYCKDHSRGKGPSPYKREQKQKWSSKGERLKLYSTERWQRLRLMKLRRDPLCEVCKVRGATSVHHKLRARYHEEEQYSLDNLQSICHECHARETQREIISDRKRSGV